MSSQHTSPNLLTLITKSSKKLTEFSKRSQPSDTFHLSGFQTIHKKKPNPPPQPTKQQQQDEMNSLYEQNQKLGYRINYLNDENNFFRISINNIQKLNNKIHKDLDGHQERAIDSQTKKKVTTKITLNPNSASKTTIPSSNNPKTPTPTPSPNPSPLEPPTSISSSFSIILNKIHLKNLQMKVGNSIRKTQKLKKIYEGSISSLTKKAQQLELEVNRLARQAEFYQIESELLNNVYRADYYMALNQQWVQAGGKVGGGGEAVVGSDGNGEKGQMRHHEGGNFEIQEEEDDSDQEYREYFKKDLEALDKLKKSTSTGQHPKSTKKPKQPNPQPQPHPSQPTPDTFPNAIRFLSGSYQHHRQDSAFKSTWYSTLYQKPPTGKSSTESFYLTSTLPKQSVVSKEFNSGVNGLGQDQNKHMTEMELFLLPKELIQFVIGSLEKEEIQQLNKLESLRKEEKEQRKMSVELSEGVRRLEGEKVRLKQLIQEEFAMFMANNLNRMQTMASTTAPKRPPLTSTTTKQLTIPRRPRPSTLHSTPTPLTSIHQRKLQADQLYLCNLYQRQLLQSIQKQDKLLQDQYKLNQQYKQKIIDRNQQENKELKVLEEEVNKCIEQVKEIKQKYKGICIAKGKVVKEGSMNNVKSRQVIGGREGVGLGQGGRGDGGGC